MARISSPRRLERIHSRTAASSTIAETDVAELVRSQTITPKISDVPVAEQLAAGILARGPNHQSSAWLPTRLIASVAISARTESSACRGSG